MVTCARCIGTPLYQLDQTRTADSLPFSKSAVRKGNRARLIPKSGYETTVLIWPGVQPLWLWHQKFRILDVQSLEWPVTWSSSSGSISAWICRLIRRQCHIVKQCSKALVTCDQEFSSRPLWLWLNSWSYQYSTLKRVTAMIIVATCLCQAGSRVYAAPILFGLGDIRQASPFGGALGSPGDGFARFFNPYVLPVCCSHDRGVRSESPLLRFRSTSQRWVPSP